jgi:hypothetical protein
MKTYKLCGDHGACCPVVKVAKKVSIKDDYADQVSLDKELAREIASL